MAKSRIKADWLRLATPADASAVSLLLEASYRTLLAPDYAPEVLTRALHLMTRANEQLLASGTFYVVEAPGSQIVGCGGWSKELPGTGAVSLGLAHIRHFATHPDWLRKGIGRQIFERCLHDAKAEGIGRFFCFSSLSAVEFYRTLGFHAVRTLDLRLTAEVTISAVSMERKLAKSIS